MSNSTVIIYLMMGIIAVAVLYILITSKRKMAATIVGVALVVALLTNPGIDQHISALTTYLLKRSGNDYTDASGLVAMNVANNAISSMLSVKNFLLFSVTTVTNKGESRNIGIGVFGNVWIWKY